MNALAVRAIFAALLPLPPQARACIIETIDRCQVVRVATWCMGNKCTQCGSCAINQSLYGGCITRTNARQCLPGTAQHRPGIAAAGACHLPKKTWETNHHSRCVVLPRQLRQSLGFSRLCRRGRHGTTPTPAPVALTAACARVYVPSARAGAAAAGETAAEVQTRVQTTPVLATASWSTPPDE